MIKKNTWFETNSDRYTNSYITLLMSLCIHICLLYVCDSEGEQEEQWLADAGLSNLISEDSEDVDNAVLLSTLTRTQAEAVQRRLDSYTLSLRKRNKPAPRDVREVFKPPITQVRTISNPRIPGCVSEVVLKLTMTST